MHILFIETITGSETAQNLMWKWMVPALSYIFRAFWVIPLFWLTKPLNSLWYQVSISCYKEKAINVCTCSLTLITGRITNMTGQFFITPVIVAGQISIDTASRNPKFISSVVLANCILKNCNCWWS